MKETKEQNEALKKSIDLTNEFIELLKKKDKELLESPYELTNEVLIEVSNLNRRIIDLENCLKQLRSQLLDTHKEDSVLIIKINEVLKG